MISALSSNVLAGSALEAEGFFNIDKPSGRTSFDVVRALRRMLAIARIGHCGTLDPFATGVLLVCFGRATRHVQALMECEKTYLATMTLGLRTDTLDRTGRVLARASVPDLKQEDFERVFKGFIGAQLQTPPLYSAVKVRGRRLYHYARCGQEVLRPPRWIEIHALDLVRLDLPQAVFRVRCSKGTYVRSLVEDIAARLGTCAVLSELERESLGAYHVRESLDWQTLTSLTRQELLARALTIR